MQPSRTYVAFAELLQEWAELPAEGPELLAWGAALAHEMMFGIWRGCNVRVLSSDDPLYALLLAQQPSATLWRNRTADLAARARSGLATVPAAVAVVPLADDPSGPTVPTARTVTLTDEPDLVVDAGAPGGRTLAPGED